MKLSGTNQTLTSSGLTALAIAVGDFNKKFDSHWNDKLYKDLKFLEYLLFNLAKDNSNTHYKISITGTGERNLTELDKMYDKLISDVKNS